VKISKSTLKRIIQEELEDIMFEEEGEYSLPGRTGAHSGEFPGEEEDERGSRGDIGADLQGLQDQLQMQGGATLEGMHSILIAALGHLARAYGEKTPSGP
jgi:hypothetical protein